MANGDTDALSPEPLRLLRAVRCPSLRPADGEASYTHCFDLPTDYRQRSQ